MQNQDWKRGLQKLKPGVYCDDKGALHLDEAELLQANGYAPTKENAEMLRKAAAEMSQRTGAKFHEV